MTLVRRLAAAVLCLALLSAAAAECFHHHWTRRDDGCIACRIEANATGALTAPVQAPRVRVVWAPVPETEKASERAPETLAARARDPPAA